MSAKIKVVGYVRVSTDRQSVEGHSLDAQEKRLRAYADAMDIEIVGLEVDAGLSASSLNRPGLQRALARLDAREARGILVVKLDRLTRSVKDLCTLVERYFKDGAVHLISVQESVNTATASGRMVLNVLTSVAQWEREATAERTTAVMQHMKSQGLFTGGWPPYGYRLEGGALKRHDGEQEVIARAKALRAAGLSLRAIATEIGPVRDGKVFHPQTIVRMTEAPDTLQAQ